ncbi:MAG: hypothetical protein M3464_02690 [Chloroflexota bacterium]|nr:hypothetical protein [Chloroflexota bacterium]
MVILTKDCWQTHILPYHPILDDEEQSVELALIDPHRLMRDAEYTNRECFYRHRALSNFPHLYLKVVVHYRRVGTSGRLMGSVVTAFPTTRFKAGEQQLWP